MKYKQHKRICLAAAVLTALCLGSSTFTAFAQEDAAPAEEPVNANDNTVIDTLEDSEEPAPRVIGIQTQDGTGIKITNMTGKDITHVWIYEYDPADDPQSSNTIENEDVKKMQQALIDQDFLDDAADGLFGPLTKAAVQEFRSANGMNPDGNTDDDMLALLYFDENNLLKDEDPVKADETVLLMTDVFTEKDGEGDSDSESPELSETLVEADETVYRAVISLSDISDEPEEARNAEDAEVDSGIGSGSGNDEAVNGGSGSGNGNVETVNGYGNDNYNDGTVYGSGETFILHEFPADKDTEIKICIEDDPAFAYVEYTYLTDDGKTEVISTYEDEKKIALEKDKAENEESARNEKETAENPANPEGLKGTDEKKTADKPETENKTSAPDTGSSDSGNMTTESKDSKTMTDESLNNTNQAADNGTGNDETEYDAVYEDPDEEEIEVYDDSEVEEIPDDSLTEADLPADAEILEDPDDEELYDDGLGDEELYYDDYIDENQDDLELDDAEGYDGDDIDEEWGDDMEDDE